MRLVLFRHGPAGDRADFARTGRPDEKRPLTPKGKRKTARSAKGLRDLIPELDLIAASPLTRARQTAEILSKAYGGPKPSLVEDLGPKGDREEILQWLLERSPNFAALVGHEPALGALAAWLMTGKAEPLFDLGKAGACLLEFHGVPKAGTAKLAWLLQPSQLRGLKD